MNLTNSLSLPEPIVTAIRNDTYEPSDSDFTTTQLIRPVRINSLLQKHHSEVTEDVADRIFALIGQAVHSVLQRGGSSGQRYLTEKRFYADFEGTRISGQIDVFDTETATLSDYKLCSRYVVADGVKPEWTAQDNMNAWLMEQNGVEVKKMNIVAIFRDWSKMMAYRRDDYPERQVQVLNVPRWPVEKTVEFIRGRIRAHKAGKDDPPLCTPEERWTKETQFALIKKGNKRASKLFDTREQAELAESTGWGSPSQIGKFRVEERPGEETRCLHFCPVWRFCSFGKLVHDR